MISLRNLVFNKYRTYCQDKLIVI